MTDMAFAQRYRQNHRKLAPSDCIAVGSMTDFCVAAGCTIKRASNTFDLNCLNGLNGHLELNKARDL
jgi:hypothetical protein